MNATEVMEYLNAQHTETLLKVTCNVLDTDAVLNAEIGNVLVTDDRKEVYLCAEDTRGIRVGDLMHQLEQVASDAEVLVCLSPGGENAFHVDNVLEDEVSMFLNCELSDSLEYLSEIVGYDLTEGEGDENTNVVSLVDHEATKQASQPASKPRWLRRRSM